MADTALAGVRIRDRRLALRMKQADLAGACNISASYLNLIEHNHRRIGGKLLLEIAACLGVEAATLSHGADDVLMGQLRDLMAQEPAGQEGGDSVEDFVTRFPGWAAQVVRQSQRIDDLEQTLHGLNDRLTHDPLLSEKMHDVLGAVAAIRSTSSILVETPNLDTDWRARFHTNIDNESRKLAETSASMAAHFDRLTRDDRSFSSPAAAVTGYLDDRNFHIEAIEQGGAAAVDHIVAEAPEFSGRAAQMHGREVLGTYAADAAIMPLAPFAEMATQLGYDPAGLGEHFHADLPAVLRRLATLPRQPDRPEIGLVSCDASGAILLRKPALGFGVPRFGAACPLWPLFKALRSPGTPLREQIASPQGAVFTAYCVAADAGPSRFDAVPVLRAYMLLIASEAGPEVALPVGTSCRVCPRPACRARREPSHSGQDLAPS